MWADGAAYSGSEQQCQWTEVMRGERWAGSVDRGGRGSEYGQVDSVCGQVEQLIQALNSSASGQRWAGQWVSISRCSLCRAVPVGGVCRLECC